jgi:hypothetical protein
MSDKKTAWLVGIGAFLLLAPGAFFGLPEGKFVVGATRILSGEVPYRDFWTMYAPGSFYGTAALFAVFGHELFVQGLAACAVWAGAAAVFFLFLRDAGLGRRIAILCKLVFALARWKTGAELTSYEPAILLVLLAWRDVLSDRPLRAGLLFGAAALFKHDVAAYAAVGASLALLLERQSPLRLLSGSLAVVAPAAVIVAWQVGADAWHDLVVFPATDFPRVRAEPYPHLLPQIEPLAAWLARPSGLAEARAAALSVARWIECALPQLFFLAGCAAALRLRGRTPRAALLALAGMPLFWLAAHVQQNTHIHTLAALAMILFGLAWEARAVPRAVLGIAGAVYALGLLIAPAIGAASLAREFPRSRILGVPGASLVLVPDEPYEAFRPIAAFVRANVPEEEPIYVGLTRHDATVYSCPLLYFLCGRAPAVRYHELHPGVTDREDVQADMLGSIAGRGVRCVVLWQFGWPNERLDAIRERNRNAVPGAGSDLLDRWIAENFAEVAAYGEYHVLGLRE